VAEFMSFCRRFEAKATMSSYFNFADFFKPSGYTVRGFGASFCAPKNRILDGRASCLT